MLHLLMNLHFVVKVLGRHVQHIAQFTTGFARLNHAQEITGEDLLVGFKGLLEAGA